MPHAILSPTAQDIRIVRRTPALLAEAMAHVPHSEQDGRSAESIIARYLLIQAIAQRWNIPTYLPSFDPDGRPLWNGQICWSLSHKDDWIAVAVAGHPVGIDVEVLRPRDPSLFSLFRVGEWEVLGGQTWENFYRLWTAKEALIKRERGTIDLLGEIHLVSADTSDMIFLYRGARVHIRSVQSDCCIYSFTLPS